MASCSNSEFQALYDIFLSFRGLDTRKKFTDHLYEALKREGFQTFRDDDEIERGENIKSELQKAIWNSRMSIIVLSKNYAYSTACLFEIQTIIEHRKRKSDHFILPVFYEVDPWEIKEQAKKLVFRGKKVTGEEVEGQRAVLKEVASMAGMVSGNQSNGYEAKFIEEIVGVLKRKQACFHLRVADHQELEKNMQNLKRKVEYLSGQEIDINEEIRSHPGRRQKHEVEIWRRDVWLLKDDVQRLEPQLVGERNVSSSALLGKHIIEKIQEATELQEKRKAFNHVLVDELPTGRLLIPPTKDFVESTKARNTENVLECLMNDDIRQIGVWGMGGIGKTTIMKHIHNKLNKEKGKFKTAYWVTVSKAFSVTKLQCDMDIAMALNLRFQDEQDESHETIRASKLYEKLSEIENYVLILDDLWEAFPLEKVGIPEPTESNGCKILLTTRSLDVCRKMDCTTVKVELLTEQEALTLFLRKVAGNDTVLTPDVEVIAAKIARECACLPLAIVTIGGSLLGLKGIHEWRNALYELISSTKEATDGESVVFEKLKFSYSHLGNKVLQDCFLYCSLYPEDRLIPVNELIEYWIAEGLIGERDSVQAEFDKGQTILGKLTRSCLLESIPSRGCGEYVKMHDLIRDMAIRITTSSPRFMVKAGKRIKSIPYEHWFADLERISFMYSSIIELPIRPPVCLQLTTLLLKEIQIHELPDNLFTNMCCLEVLDLSQNIMRSLPESISNLENLRALRLVNSFFLEYVPSVEKLKALKEFKLTTSRIQEVPKGIEELVNIRKLDLSGNRQLGTFPSWKVRRLSKLQYLRTEKTKVEVSAEDLLCLRQLNVVSVRFHNVQELTRYVTSHQFQGLEYYCLMVGENHSLVLLDQGKKCYINFKSVAYGSGVDQLELPAGLNIFQLDGFHDPISLSAIPWLKNAKDLGRCKICYCNGLEFIFSSSIFSKDGQISLGTVKELDLFFLPRFRGLFDGIAPPHGIYFDLKALSFWGCPNVKKIFSVQLFQNFPNLETLRVGDCKNVEDIIVETAEMSCRGNHQDYTNSISLPKLKTLLLIDLPRLKCVYNGVMVCPSIEKVDVGNCPMLRRLPLALHSDQATAPPALKVIFAEKEWWESLEWDDPLTKTILQPYVGKYYG